ncbi:S-layer homology domain-containing protein [Butyricicoccus faecihominis]|uniref:S-layer homology domain-containing protein n=1 Tax=Butyricicoccus faecihominis TaxID=1712515 RepID=UPI002479457A|nr:S-layer homology domain-containing protein [Butyricicoccus faecihominis]MCQ5128173.1 S-layer homology domain-containing protein [Butyricicoccus faecihominis]
MKKSYLKCLLMVIMTIALTLCSAGAFYSDVSSSSWYYDTVKEATDAGLMNGDGDGTFRPDDYVSRAEAATVLSRLPVTGWNYYETYFVDVPEGAWYSQTASSYGNLLGGNSRIEDSSQPLGYMAHFYPVSNVEREDFAVGLYNLFDLSSIRWRAHFEDLNQVTKTDSYGYNYEQAVCAMRNLYIMVGSGSGDGYFKPKQALTRAELAQVLCNLKNTDEPLLIEKMSRR